MKRLLPALLVSVVLVALLVLVTDLRWDAIAGTLRSLDVPLVLLSFVVYAASFAGRGVRLAVLLPGAGSLPHLISISTRHIFLAVVLPLRSGEASLPVMLARECGRPAHEGVSVLGLMRVLDLASVATALLIGLALTGRLGGGATDAAGSLALRALAVFGVLVLGLALLPVVARRAARLADSPRKALAFAGRVAAHVAALRRGQLLLAVATSLATWAATYATCYLLLHAMAAPEALGPAATAIDFPTSLIGTSGLHLSAVIPVSPLAGVGTWEAGWTAGYTFVGMSEQAAATSAVASHVVILGFITLFGGVAWLARLRARDGRGDRI